MNSGEVGPEVRVQVPARNRCAMSHTTSSSGPGLRREAGEAKAVETNGRGQRKQEPHSAAARFAGAIRASRFDAPRDPPR